MSNGTLNRGTDERIRATLTFLPEDEFDGLGAATLWWVLTRDKAGDHVAESKTNSDTALTIVDDGATDGEAVFTVDLTPDETESLTKPTYYQHVVVQDESGDLSAAQLDPYELALEDTPAGEVTGGT